MGSTQAFSLAHGPPSTFQKFQSSATHYAYSPFWSFTRIAFGWEHFRSSHRPAVAAHAARRTPQVDNPADSSVAAASGTTPLLATAPLTPSSRRRVSRRKNTPNSGLTSDSCPKNDKAEISQQQQTACGTDRVRSGSQPTSPQATSNTQPKPSRSSPRDLDGRARRQTASAPFPPPPRRESTATPNATPLPADAVEPGGGVRRCRESISGSQYGSGGGGRDGSDGGNKSSARLPGGKNRARSYGDGGAARPWPSSLSPLSPPPLPSATQAPSALWHPGRGPGPSPPSPPPPAAPPGDIRPPPGSVMSGWGLAGAQPQMNSVYRLIRKKELQHHYNHHYDDHNHLYERHPDKGASASAAAVAAAAASGDGIGNRSGVDLHGTAGPSGRVGQQQLQPSSSSSSSITTPRVTLSGRDVSPRLGDVHRHSPPMPPPPPPGPPLQLQEHHLPYQRQCQHHHDHHHHQEQDCDDPHQKRQRKGAEDSPWEGNPGLMRAPPPPPLPLAPFASGHTAVDRVVRIRQIRIRQRQQQQKWSTGGEVGDGASGREYGNCQTSPRDARPPTAGYGVRSDSAQVAAAPVAAREGVWAADRVPTALLGGCAGAVWGSAWDERTAGGGGAGLGVDPNTSRIEVTLLGPPSSSSSPSSPGDTVAGGGGAGGSDGYGSGVSNLLRETLISDLSLLNPVYRMIRKHELLLHHRPQQPSNKTQAAGASSASSFSAAAAAAPGARAGGVSGAASSSVSSTLTSAASSAEPWAADDFADVMLGGLILPHLHPHHPPGASELQSGSGFDAIKESESRLRSEVAAGAARGHNSCSSSYYTSRHVVETAEAEAEMEMPGGVAQPQGRNLVSS